MQCLQADMQDTAMLHVLKLPPDMRDPLVVAKVAIANMLSPDLLCFQVIIVDIMIAQPWCFLFLVHETAANGLCN